MTNSTNATFVAPSTTAEVLKSSRSSPPRILMPPLATIRSHNLAAGRVLRGMTALIVGGTSGLGEAVALKLAALLPEPHIVISGRKQDAGERVVASLKEVRLFSDQASIL
jgi:hypothetical protein